MAQRSLQQTILEGSLGLGFIAFFTLLTHGNLVQRVYSASLQCQRNAQAQTHCQITQQQLLTQQVQFLEQLQSATLQKLVTQTQVNSSVRVSHKYSLGLETADGQVTSLAALRPYGLKYHSAIADQINQSLAEQHQEFQITETMSFRDYLFMVIMLLLSLVGIWFGAALTLGQIR